VSNCRSFDCEYCAPKMSAVWAKRVLEEHVDWFFTITLVPEDLKQARFAWQKFLRGMRRRYGEFECVRFTERGSLHGMKHYHVLVRCPVVHLDFSWIKSWLVCCGYGEQNAIKKLTSLEHRRRTIWYVVKYCTKEGHRGFADGERKVDMTQGFKTGGASLTLAEKGENDLWQMVHDLYNVVTWDSTKLGAPPNVPLEHLAVEADSRGLTLSRSFQRHYARWLESRRLEDLQHHKRQSRYIELMESRPTMRFVDGELIV